MRWRRSAECCAILQAARQRGGRRRASALLGELLALRRRRFRVLVLERVEETREVGFPLRIPRLNRGDKRFHGGLSFCYPSSGVSCTWSPRRSTSSSLRP